MRKSADRRRSLRRARLLFAAAATLPALAHGSTTRNWIAGNGDWSTLGNWNPTGVPAAGDTVDIVNDDATLRKITYDYSGAAVTLADIFISNNGGGSDSLLLNSTNALTLNTSGIEDIGGFPTSGLSGSGIGAITVESSNNNVRQLNLGYNLSDHGTYNLTGDGTLTVSGLNAVENVGLSGLGTFSQSNGANNLNGVNTSLYLGANAGAAGSYALSNLGTLTVAGNNGNEYIGYSGTGAFTQSGGTNNVIGTSSNLYLGYNTGAAGTYSLSGAGTLTVPVTEYVGYNGSGSFNQSGGTNNVGAIAGIAYLQVGGVAGTTATYSLSGSGLLNLIGGAVIGGAGGSASFVQSGGTCSITNTNSSIYVQSGGTYSLSGTGQFSSVANEFVDGDSTALFNQTGGTNTASSALVLGYTPTLYGAYSLSGSGTLACADEAIGYNSNGFFNQSGGANIVTGNSLVLGNNQKATGVFVQSNGVLSTAGNEDIGLSGAGIFNQSGGANTLVGTAGFLVAANPGSVGIYTLSGNGTLTGAYLEYIGHAGNGTFNQSGGANILLANAPFAVGAGVNSVGSYFLSGTGTLSTTAGEQIGFLGTGTFNQSGGVNDLAGGSISIAFNDSANGAYLLSGGLLSNCNNIGVGPGPAAANGSGVLTVSDSGYLAIAGTLQIWKIGLVNLDVPNSSVGNLSIYNGGILNLNGALTVNFGSPANDPVASVLSYLKSGYNGGAWTGTTGIISTSAQIQTGPALSVGYADGNTDIGTPAGPNQIVVKYTLAGDANLDGQVNFNDLVAVIQNFNKAGTDWAHGNFLYGSSTNFNDLVAVVQNFNKTLPPPSGSSNSLGPVSLPLISLTDAQLPEPTSLPFLGTVYTLLFLRRRRKHPVLHI